VCNDVKWRVYRDKRITHLMVDDDLVTGVSSVGATTLDTDGHLWIGNFTSAAVSVSASVAVFFCLSVFLFHPLLFTPRTKPVPL